DAVYAPTFGANRKKLPAHLSVYETNRKLLALCREAVGNDTLVGGDLSPTGELLYPMGMLTEDELIAIYEEQIQAFYDFGVDFIVIETMMDIREVKCALLAKANIYKEKACPVFVTVTLEESGKTLTGTDPLTALLIAESYGATAFGFNCSSGPDKMIPLLDSIVPYASVPLITKPNAGLPTEVDGKTVFSMNPPEFKKYVRYLVEHGANIIGGCCGTTPEYIKEISALKIPVMPVSKKVFPFVSSQRKTVLITEDTSFGAFHFVTESDPVDFCYDLQDAECDVIHLTFSENPEIMENLEELIKNIGETVTTPVFFDTESEAILKLVRRYYTGAQCIQ
ncbi:MAG: homocysteine S-methyltransferase family protein, partial [Clostridia bacterium]|nr:homocysteine S-methyltransferase family protein [Clostridia bacterium]